MDATGSTGTKIERLREKKIFVALSSRIQPLPSFLVYFRLYTQAFFQIIIGYRHKSSIIKTAAGGKALLFVRRGFLSCEGTPIGAVHLASGSVVFRSFFSFEAFTTTGNDIAPAIACRIRR